MAFKNRHHIFACSKLPVVPEIKSEPVQSEKSNTACLIGTLDTLLKDREPTSGFLNVVPFPVIDQAMSALHDHIKKHKYYEKYLFWTKPENNMIRLFFANFDEAAELIRDQEVDIWKFVKREELWEEDDFNIEL